MKTLTILIIVVLVEVLFINALPGPSMAEVGTLASVVTFLDTTLKKMTQSELAMLEKRVTQADINKATALIEQSVSILWG